MGVFSRKTLGQAAHGVSKGEWSPEQPRKSWPRKAKLIQAAVEGMFGISLYGLTSFGSGTTSSPRRRIVPGQQAETVSNVSLSNQATAGVGHTQLAWTATGDTTSLYHFGAHAVHGYLDPTTYTIPYALVLTDRCVAAPYIGASSYFFGWFDVGVAGDPESLTGIVWFTDSASTTWKALVREGTGSPTTVRYLYDTGISSLSMTRLGIVLDGSAKTALFYLGGSEKARFTPTTPLGRFNTGAVCGWGFTTANGGTSYFRILSGSNPRILSIVEV